MGTVPLRVPVILLFFLVFHRQVCWSVFPVRFPGVPDQLLVRAVAQLPHLHRRPLALRLQRRFRLPSILGHTSPSVRGDQGKKSLLKWDTYCHPTSTLY